MSVHYESNQLPTCCGVREIGVLLDSEENKDAWRDGVSAYARTFDNWQQALDHMKTSHDDGIVLQVWFVKRKNWQDEWEDEYDNNALRLLVQQIDGVVHLHTGINPNSDNEIDGYLWINNK